MASKDDAIHSNAAPFIYTLGQVRVRQDVAFRNYQGEEKSGIRSRAEKAIEKLQQPLSKFLEPDEAVFYVARCQAPASAFEQMAFGWYTYRVTAALLVFTNRRILHFVVKADGTWKESIRSANWGDLEMVQVKGWLSPVLELTCRDGKKQKYWGVRRDDSKVIKLLAQVLLLGSKSEMTSAQQMTQLCPQCKAALSPGIYRCNECRLVFKDEATLVKRSLLIPGGGYFYTGNVFLGIGDAIAEVYLLLLTLVWVPIALGVVVEPVEPGEEPFTAAAAWILVVFFGGLLAIEKWATIHHCRRFIREYIPIKN